MSWRDFYKIPGSGTLMPGFKLAAPIQNKDVRAGDHVLLWGRGVSYAGLTGEPVAKAGSVNIQIESIYTQYTNAGPVKHVSLIKIPRYHVAAVIREPSVHPVMDSAWSHEQPNVKWPEAKAAFNPAKTVSRPKGAKEKSYFVRCETEPYSSTGVVWRLYNLDGSSRYMGAETRSALIAELHSLEPNAKVRSVDE